MAHRTGRSNSIPIPAPSTTNRNIEDILSMSLLANPGSFLGRPQFTSQSLSPAAPGPIRSATRSLTNSYEPRIIRASPSRNSDTSCASTSPVQTQNRHRRPSRSNIAPNGSQRNVSGSRPVFSVLPPTTSPSTSFPRPAYLEHSALRHLLRTETPSNLPLSRYKSESTIHEIVHPTAIGLPYFQRDRSPLIDSDDEGSISPPREVAPASPTNGPSSTDATVNLPTRWSDHARSSLLSVCSDGREIKFVGASAVGDKEAAAVRANYAVPPTCGIYYYEVEIVNKGQKGSISIGFSGPHVKLSRLPGWEKLSWGYHGEDGSSFSAEKTGSPYGPTYTTGDVIGCGIDFSQNKAFYTKNGALLGLVFDNVGKECELFPCIGLRYQGETIRANFGQDPFQYDIEDHVHQQRNQIWTNIQNTPLDRTVLQRINEDGNADSVPAGDSSYGATKAFSIESVTNSDHVRTSSEAVIEDWGPAGKKTKSTIDKLVLSYLTHHGYAKSAKALKFQSDDGYPSTSSASTAVSDEIDLRTKIVSAVMKGDIDSALHDTRDSYPRVLEKEEGLMLFKLKCRKFVELLLEAAEALKRVKNEEEEEESVWVERGGIISNTHEFDGDVGLDGMDIDEDAFPSSYTNGISKSLDGGMPSTRVSGRRRPSAVSSNAAQSAVNDALHYGQALEGDYKDDVRPEVKAHLKRTFSVVAYEDPLAVGGDVGEISGQGARDTLAAELNQAILESQGRPTRPALEILYRQTSACLLQLGIMGVGAAVFADIQKEFFDL